MAVEELRRSGRPLGPLVWALKDHGCALTLLPGPTRTGTVKVRLLYPEDEYLEKQCRRILADWRTDTGTAQLTPLSRNESPLRHDQHPQPAHRRAPDSGANAEAHPGSTTGTDYDSATTPDRADLIASRRLPPDSERHPSTHPQAAPGNLLSGAALRATRR